MESFGIASNASASVSRRGAQAHLVIRSQRRQYRGASNPWRLLGSLPHRAHPEIFRPFLRQEFPRGRGASNLWGLRGRVTAWVSRADFFCWSKTFEYFSRNQTFKRTRPRARGGSVNDHKDLAGASASGRRGNKRDCSIYFLRAGSAPGGGSNLYDLSIAGPVGPQRTFFREIPEDFFSRGALAFAGQQTQRLRSVRRARRSREKLPRNSGWGGG